MSHQPMLKVKTAGGSGLTVMVGTIRGISPAKKAGQSLLKVLWSGKHGATTKREQRKVKDGMATFTVLMEHTALLRKVEMLRGAG